MFRPVLIAASIATALWILPSASLLHMGLPSGGLPTSRAADVGESVGEEVGENVGDEADPPRPVAVLDRPQVQLLLSQYCGDCHGDGADEGGFAIEAVQPAGSLVSDFNLWLDVRGRIHNREMPPASSEPIPSDQREAVISWIDSAIREAACDPSIARAPAPLRRLTRNEYRNTIRDLLGIPIDASNTLPSEGAGGEGFDNAAEVLLMSPLHAEKYLEAAKMALDYAERDNRARAALLLERQGRGRGGEAAAESAEQESDEARARRVLQRFAQRAYRRPVESHEIDPLITLYSTARQQGDTFASACFYAMQAVLISPHFLFRVEAPAASEVPEPLSDHELAVRLSYFLWESLPDEPLRKAADDGKLSDPEVLRAQVLRMLGDGRLLDAALSFTGQWLGTAELGRTVFPDRELYPWIDDPTRAAMRDQPGYVFAEILRTDAPLLELLDARWTFLTTELVRVYNLPRNELKENIRQHLIRVELPEGSVHGSLLAMAGVMAVASYPKRTSPVLRGAWVLDNLLGSPSPPPPPDIPELDAAGAEASNLTLRQQLEAHRANPACATCHDRLDPIGFALENLDMIGRWREQDAGGPIDASGALPDGTKIEGVEGLKQYLVQHQRDVFVEQLARKLLGYALGRGLVAADLCALDTIVQRVREADYRAQALVIAIVESEPFRTKSGGHP